ncbi:ankyrin repeat domain-containing protein [Aggregicoccus sp. 17bor-14]|uniref:ankyrin repeat domain-containing protein n=1 Tax=Myxococcaceae TaxID=31 RepID=UPI00129D1A37|nr:MULTISPECIES: ankyrin repeat domain-containing protein [Myxococcaceae]MBF5046229.1 ankyrin repeat domain-containing protein [Simulacricoccus sp. 17bor-14]MRI91953.1 ankyrin repeat domain-containing protein [Aggregicoccus sp. 17bor-14]
MPDAPPSPLFDAVAAGDVKAALALLDGGEDPNPFDAAGLTPLMHAAMEGSEPLVLALLDGGADPDLADPLGETAFLKAAAHGQRGVCAQLGRFAGREQRELAEALLRTGPERLAAGPPEEEGEAPGALQRGLAALGAGVADALGDSAPQERLDRARRAREGKKGS